MPLYPCKEARCCHLHFLFLLTGFLFCCLKDRGAPAPLKGVLFLKMILLHILFLLQYAVLCVYCLPLKFHKSKAIRKHLNPHILATLLLHFIALLFILPAFEKFELFPRSLPRFATPLITIYKL